MLDYEEDSLIQKAEDLEVLTRNQKVIPQTRIKELHHLTRISKKIFNNVPSTIAEPLGVVHARIRENRRQNLLISLFFTVVAPLGLAMLFLLLYVQNPILTMSTTFSIVEILGLFLFIMTLLFYVGGFHTIGHLFLGVTIRVRMLGAYPKYHGLLWVWEPNYEEFLEAGAVRRILLYSGGPLGAFVSLLPIWLLLGSTHGGIVLVFLVTLEIIGYKIGIFTDFKKMGREYKLYRSFQQHEGNLG